MKRLKVKLKKLPNDLTSSGRKFNMESYMAAFQKFMEMDNRPVIFNVSFRPYEAELGQIVSIDNETGNCEVEIRDVFGNIVSEKDDLCLVPWTVEGNRLDCDGNILVEYIKAYTIHII